MRNGGKGVGSVDKNLRNKVDRSDSIREFWRVPVHPKKFSHSISKLSLSIISIAWIRHPRESGGPGVIFLRKVLNLDSRFRGMTIYAILQRSLFFGRCDELGGIRNSGDRFPFFRLAYWVRICFSNSCAIFGLAFR